MAATGVSEASKVEATPLPNLSGEDREVLRRGKGRRYINADDDVNNPWGSRSALLRLPYGFSRIGRGPSCCLLTVTVEREWYGRAFGG